MEDFETYRPLLFSIAYRMTGLASEAEDIVQEAYLRYAAASPNEIHALKAYLTTTVCRLCLDHLKSARVWREQYIGPWLPEPIQSADLEDVVVHTLEQREAITMAFLLLLERLTPYERAVLLLAFGHMELAQQRARQMPRETKQLARMIAGLQVNCPWCIDIGVFESRKAGIAEAKLYALLDYEHSPLFTQEEMIVLRYAQAMTQTPLRIPDDLFDALKASYSERQMVELTLLIAWENCVARFNHALGIEADGLSGDASCLLSSAYCSCDKHE